MHVAEGDEEVVFALVGIGCVGGVAVEVFVLDFEVSGEEVAYSGYRWSSQRAPAASAFLQKAVAASA